MQIRIDTRENEEVVAEFVLLQERLVLKDVNVQLSREQLVCGDVIVGNCCFERKESTDFIGSIIDHRLKKQCEQMRLNFEHAYIVLVGDVFSTQSMITPMAPVGAQCSVIIRFGIPFIHVQNNEQFAWAVYSIVSKLSDGKVFNPNEHKVYKYDVSADDKFVAMLAATGIGLEKAKKISAKCDYNISKVCENIESLKDIDGIGPKTISQLKDVLGCFDIRRD